MLPLAVSKKQETSTKRKGKNSVKPSPQPPHEMTEHLMALDQLLNKEKALQDKRCKDIEKRLKENSKMLREEDLQNVTRADEELSETSLTIVLKSNEFGD